MKHLMIDLETLSTRPNAAVLSIGVVLFDAEGVHWTKEYTLDVESQIRRGRNIEFDTLTWWVGQGVDAQKVFRECAQYGVDVRDALTEIAAEIKNHVPVRKQLCVWSNALSFDVVILRGMYEQFAPDSWRVWDYPYERCYRTIVNTFDPEKKLAPPKAGVSHKALDDALWQAEYLTILNEKSKGMILGG